MLSDFKSRSWEKHWLNILPESSILTRECSGVLMQHCEPFCTGIGSYSAHVDVGKTTHKALHLNRMEQRAIGAVHHLRRVRPDRLISWTTRIFSVEVRAQGLVRSDGVRSLFRLFQDDRTNRRTTTSCCLRNCANFYTHCRVVDYWSKCSQEFFLTLLSIHH